MVVVNGVDTAGKCNRYLDMHFGNEHVMTPKQTYRNFLAKKRKVSRTGPKFRIRKETIVVGGFDSFFSSTQNQ